MNRINERLLFGEAITEFLEELAALRIDIFKEYPYLYSGSSEDELAYLAGYAKKPGACVILAEDNGDVIGAATGVPLEQEQPALRDPFSATPYIQAKIYYIGELLFRKAYRNQGLGQRLLARMENHICSLGSFQKIICATVDRPLDHPSRPHDYIPITHFLSRTGFARLDGIVTHFTWGETDGVKSSHTMQFWMKDLLQTTAPPKSTKEKLKRLPSLPPKSHCCQEKSPPSRPQ